MSICSPIFNPPKGLAQGFSASPAVRRDAKVKSGAPKPEFPNESDYTSKDRLMTGFMLRQDDGAAPTGEGRAPHEVDIYS
jgi:hypothetical protein